MHSICGSGSRGEHFERKKMKNPKKLLLICGGLESASGIQEIREIISYCSQSVLTRTPILPAVTLVTPNMNTPGYLRNLNPFLVDEDDNNISSFGSFFSTGSPPNFPPPPPPPATLKLPVFWADAPVAWFAAVETQIKLRQVTNPWTVPNTSSHIKSLN